MGLFYSSPKKLSRILVKYPEANVTLVVLDEAHVGYLEAEAKKMGKVNCWKVEIEQVTSDLIV
jgi:hypothetical protein